MRVGIGIGLAAMVVAGTSGCSRATRLAQVSKDPAMDGLTFHNAVAVFVESNTPHRRAIERELAGRFRNTTPAYNDVDEPSRDSERLLRQLRAGEFDGAIVMSVADVRTTERWVGGLNYTTPRYRVTDTTVTVDTKIYSLPDGKVLFSARSETVNPGDDGRLTESVMRHVAAELRHDALLQTR